MLQLCVMSGLVLALVLAAMWILHLREELHDLEVTHEGFRAVANQQRDEAENKKHELAKELANQITASRALKDKLDATLVSNKQFSQAGHNLAVKNDHLKAKLAETEYHLERFMRPRDEHGRFVKAAEGDSEPA